MPNETKLTHINSTPAPSSLTVKCPTCSTPVSWGPSSPFRPFCSDRCKLIDLGEWASEQRSIPGDSTTPPAESDEF